MSQDTQQLVPVLVRTVSDVIHHHVHTRQLAPNLSEEANVSAVDVAGREELHIGHLLGLALNLKPLLDLLEFASNPWRVWIAVAVGENQDLLASLPAVLAGEPTGRLWEEHHAEEEDDRRNHLQSPWNAEGSWALDERAAVRDVEHDHDAPSDSPLLSADQTSSLGWWCDFRDVDWNLGRADTDAEAIDDAADDEHWDVLRGSDDNAANDPDDGANF